MKIWLVDTDMKVPCAWSTKEQAINYFKKDCEECGWTWRILYNGDEKNPESYLYYLVIAKDYSFHVDIYSIYFNENPYFGDI